MWPYCDHREVWSWKESTVGNVKKSHCLPLRSIIMIDMGMSRKAKTMRLGENLKLDKAVYLCKREWTMSL